MKLNNFYFWFLSFKYWILFRMGKQPVIYRASRQMDPPSKDFVSLEMTPTEIIINLFRIRYTLIVLTDFSLPEHSVLQT